ncbi:hypothetical protein FISHEDRAFT_49489, partial [Fistulina hepatica ATCC 64428]
SSRSSSSVMSRTLFVSNLPYSATNEGLQLLFSDIAPVKSAFVVQSGGQSKGVGYVAFALAEDAQTTFDHVSTHGLRLNGRAVRVEWAQSRSKKNPGDRAPEDSISTEKSTPVVHKSVVVRPTQDPLAVRTIVISGLPKDVDKHTLWKKMRKCPGAEQIVLQDGDIAHVLFETSSSALDAISKLHAHVFKGSLLSVALKKRLDSKLSGKQPSGKATDTKASDKSHAAPSHASRLIIRNIPFDATEQDLRTIFLPYGPIWKIDIPRDSSHKNNDDESAETSRTSSHRNKGFAFVWMLTVQDAQRALTGANARASTAQHFRERVIAVDWALSKDRWMETQEHAEDQASGAEDDSGSGSGSDDGNEDDVGNSDSTTASGPQSEIDEDEEEEDLHATNDTDHLGTTLFVRNVPWDAEEDGLRDLFASFGAVRYARITRDAATGRSRGTGFVNFWKHTDAEAVVARSAAAREEMEANGGVGVPVPKANPFLLPASASLITSSTSLLTPDPSSVLARPLTLGGRTLDVVLAVTRTTANRLTEVRERAREKADKRNMYLLREGVILPTSPAAATLSAADLERRTQSYNTRRALLNSNPLLYVSRTRLSLRQVPTWASERVLKRLVVYAVRAFEKDVKAGVRAGLSREELGEEGEDAIIEGDTKLQNMDAGGDAKESGMEKMDGKARGKSGLVKQAKIVRNAERVDPITGRARSRGYGFVEMHEHADALRVLRYVNNNTSSGNPEDGGLFGKMRAWYVEELREMVHRVREGIGADAKELDKDEKNARIKRLQDEINTVENGKPAKSGMIVEFSVENVQVVKRRQERVEIGRSRRSQTQAGEHDTSNGKDNKRKHAKDAEDYEVTSKRRRVTSTPTTDKKKRKSLAHRALGANDDVDTDVAHMSSPKGSSKKAEAVGPTNESATDAKGQKQSQVGFIIGRKRKEKRRK